MKRHILVQYRLTQSEFQFINFLDYLKKKNLCGIITQSETGRSMPISVNPNASLTQSLLSSLFCLQEVQQ